MNEITCKRLEANVGRELSRIRNQLSAIEAREKSFADATAAAEESSGVVAQNLAGGLASQLEYRLTQNGFLQTKSGLLSAIYEYNLARAEWDRATGRYFQFSDPPSPKATARQALPSPSSLRARLRRAGADWKVDFVFICSFGFTYSFGKFCPALQKSLEIVKSGDRGWRGCRGCRAAQLVDAVVAGVPPADH
jgi:hypothetical protein